MGRVGQRIRHRCTSGHMIRVGRSPDAVGGGGSRAVAAAGAAKGVGGALGVRSVDSPARIGV